MNRLVDKSLRSLLGVISRPACQPLLEALHRATLAGMNIGPAGDPLASGEARVLRYCARLSSPDGRWIVFDVGANQGAYALLAASLGGPAAQVYCFEPSPAAFKRLTANTARAANIHTFNFGLAETDGEATLYGNEPGSGIASLDRRHLDHFGIAVEAQEVVRLRTLDAVREELGRPHIRLLKLDIEGHEIKALRDFFELLAGRYRLYRVLRQGLRPLPRYRETHENFLTANYLAVSKALDA